MLEFTGHLAVSLFKALAYLTATLVLCVAGMYAFGAHPMISLSVSFAGLFLYAVWHMAKDAQRRARLRYK